MAFHLGYVADSDEEGRRTWGQDFVSQFFDQAVPWSSRSHNSSSLQATEDENVGTARRSTGQPTPKKRPRETQALSCNSCRDSGYSGTALQHRFWKSNASLRPKMSIWKAQGRERPGALGSSMYDDG